jgi:hypothetical protein
MPDTICYRRLGVPSTRDTGLPPNPDDFNSLNPDRCRALGREWPIFRDDKGDNPLGMVEQRVYLSPDALHWVEFRITLRCAPILGALDDDAMETWEQPDHREIPEARARELLGGIGIDPGAPVAVLWPPDVEAGDGSIVVPASSSPNEQVPPPSMPEAAGPDPSGPSVPVEVDPADLVTLDQAAGMVHKTKRALEYYKTKGTLPDPVVEGGAGKASLYDWKVIGPWLTKEFNIPLPERFPGR